MANEFIVRKGLLSLGGITVPLTGVSSTYTVQEDDFTIEVNSSSNVTINLPSAIGIQGKIYDIKNSGTGVVTVDANGSETIDGQLTKTLNQYGNLFVQSNGANWIIAGLDGTSGKIGRAHV